MKTSSYVQNFLEKTRNNNNRTQMNLTGRRDSGFSNYTGPSAFRQFTGRPGGYFAATGAPGAAAAPAPQPMATPSHPYVINVSNSSASAVPNFPLFNANALVYGGGGGTWTAGNYVLTNVTVSSGIGGVTYQTLVGQSQTQPFTIGSTAITAVVNNAQIQQTITVTTTDANGQSQSVPIIFLKDPYQNQTDILVNNTPFRIDGTTVLLINSVLPNAVFNLFLYPAQNLNPASQLMGAPELNTFANPGLIRVLPQATGAM